MMIPSSISIMTLVGGMSIQKQLRLLKAQPKIVVATPGRLWELMANQNISHLRDLKYLRFFVLDEVDRC